MRLLCHYASCAGQVRVAHTELSVPETQSGIQATSTENCSHSQTCATRIPRMAVFFGHFLCFDTIRSGDPENAIALILNNIAALLETEMA